MTAAGRQHRVPVEDDRVVLVADQHSVSWLRALFRERFFHAEPGEAVGEVADGLVVAEVGLPDPPDRLLALDQVSAVPGPDDLEAGLADRGRADPHPRGRRLRPA